MSELSKVIVGISQGDINGVGLEVILKTFSDHAITEICTPIIFSSQKTIAYYKKLLGLDDLNFHLLKDIKNNNIIYINYLYLDSALFAILDISHLYDVFIVDERRSRGAISNNPLTMET